MNTPATITTLAAICLIAGCGTVTHTPAGTSVELALARKGELVKLATPPPTAIPAAGSTAPGAPVAEVKPPLPERNEVAEKVAEAYSRGVFCLEAEKDAEAIAAFEEVVQLDPSFSEAWEKLAMLYEKGGDSKKAMEAFNKAKKIARQ
jgi:tetratricopeptide (TPR) repeat protein